jgi:effector-binding domain-containing protein
MCVETAGENTENVVFKTVGPVQFASAIHKGNFDTIDEVNESVAMWINDSGYDFDGSMFNIYHVSPGHDPNPENWVTEVCYPVKKK